jgi:hypothetical protein
MAMVRKPRTDEQLAADEREMLVEQLRQDAVDVEIENQTKLAAAGEPEARAAVAALRAVSRTNNTRMTADQQEAVGVSDVTQDTPVEDERATDARAKALRQKIAQAKFEEEQARKAMSATDRAKALMKNHWQRWSREGSENYSKASNNLRLNVGRDAVALVDGGVFDSHLDVAQFIQRMTPTVQQQKESDWTEDLEEELKELRGDD